MKIFKIILLLTIISFFSSISSNAKAKSCSGLKVLSHKWLVCKSGSDKYGSEEVATVNEDTTKDKKHLITTDKLKNKGKSFFEKLKNIGGKNIGEPG